MQESSATIWYFYPEFGYLTKLHIITLYIAIIITFINLLFQIITKKQKEKINIIFNTISWLFSISAIFSSIIILLRIYDNCMLIYSLLMITAIILILLFRKSKIINNKIILTIFIVLLLYILLTSNIVWPFEATNYNEIDNITIDY